MTYERLTAADAVFLRIETLHEPQHVGSLSVIEPRSTLSACNRCSEVCSTLNTAPIPPCPSHSTIL